MISGAHVVIYSTDAEADKAFFRDVLKLNSVDVGHDWLIFALPPAEMAVHPSEGSTSHELYLMCDDIEGFTKDMAGRGVKCSAIQDQPWGRLVMLTLPGGGEVGVYEPRHESPERN
jgi:catechol 2,3-dioxygenase-like lactoylglutathione lyase family enzyme